MRGRYRLKTFSRPWTVVLSLFTIIAGLVIFKLVIFSKELFEWGGHRPEYIRSPSQIINVMDVSPLLPHKRQSSPHPLRFSNKKDGKLKIYHNKGLELRRTFDCEKLFEGSKEEQDKVTQFHKSHNYSDNVISNEDALEITSDCDAFKTVRGYRSDFGTQEEKKFTVAYVILVHKDFEHLERLLRSLYMPQHSFCIHIDEGSPENLKKAVSRLASCFNNVHIASNPQRIIYAHVSRLLADIGCMKDLLEKNKSWKYLINMAATEFPLRTNLETAQILDVLHGLNDIHESFRSRRTSRFSKEYAVVDGKIKAVSPTYVPAPHNITVIKGQAYNTYSREFLQWVFSNQKTKDFLKWSEKTYSPDEHYWGTLNDLYHNAHLKTPGGFKGDPDKKGYLTKYINWQYGKDSRHKCQGKIVHKICIFSALDLPLLVPEKHLAVNKFDLTSDPIAYACMEDRLEKRQGTSKISLRKFRQLYFIRYKGG